MDAPSLTNLANCAVHPSLAQRIARHSDINLTMSRHTHSAPERMSEAVAKLPDFTSDVAQAGAPRATDTDGDSVLGFCLAKQGRPQPTEEDQIGQLTGSAHAGADARKTPQIKGKAAVNAAKEVVRPAGLEPAACGLGNRCSIR